MKRLKMLLLFVNGAWMTVCASYIFCDLVRWLAR